MESQSRSPAPRSSGEAPVDTYQLLRDLPLIGVALTSPSSKHWLQVNQTLCDFLGYSYEELATKTWTELTHPDDVDDDVADFDRVMRGEANGYRRDKRYIRRDGSIAYGNIAVQAVRNTEGRVEYFIATVADVGARVEAEASARRSAALLEKLSEQVPGVIYQYLLLPDGRSMFPFASDGMRDIYELSPDDVREDATVVFTRLHPDDLSRVADGIAESARTLAPWGCDYRVVLPQKGLRWLRGDARPERLSDGSTLWYGFITDSTEQQLAREALEESERRYRVQIEHAPEAIVVFDVAQNRFADANSNAERLFGLSREALLARGIAEVSPPTQPDGRSSEVAGREYITRTLTGETPVFEWTHRTAVGAAIACEVRLVTMPYDGRVMVRGSITDMTERKRARNTLSRLNAAIDSSINGIAMADLDGRLTYVNRAILELWGYSDAAELLGRDVRSFWANDGHIGEVIASIQATGAWSGERTAVRRDGSKRVVQLNASLFADSSGVPIGMLASFVDVTEYKRLQSELLQAQKMESVGRLAGGIAHDFNNLLTIIAAYLDFALTGVATDSDLFRDLFEVRRAANSAASLTQQLLAFSRKQIIAPKELDLNEVVHRVHGMLKRLLGEDIDLSLLTAPDLWHVRFDPGQAEQILVNLAANARDAMPSGGKLTLETSNVQLDDDYRHAHPGASVGEFVLLAVSDTGDGMSDEVRAHAFEPFFTTKESGRGTGLGLAMIDGAVSQNGGRVELYSEVGHGTSFKIYLPRVHAAEPGPSAIDRPRSARGGHETIVVVEDEQSVRTLIGRILGSHGYRVFPFSGGSAALEWMRTSNEAIDLLLTDVIMPGLNGRELAEQVAKLRPATRILYASGYTANVIVHHGVLKPGVNFLAKPFSAEELRSKVRETIDALNP